LQAITPALLSVYLFFLFTMFKNRITETKLKKHDDQTTKTAV
jgi:hypothetical protein